MIEAVGVSKYYGARRALSDVSFSIQAGEVVGFLGLNGAGKTTVLKVMCGLLVPSSGKVTVDGVDGIEEPRELRKRIGFLPDRPPLHPEMTVRQMVSYAARLCGLPAERVSARVDEVLLLCGIADVADDLIEWLSHGYRQRVGIAIAVAHEPKLVVLDEPISGLDPAQIVAMRGLIRGLKEKHTVLISSHILSEISHTCDRILVLHQGRVVAQGNEATLAAGVNPLVEIVARGRLSDADHAYFALLEGVSEIEAQPAGEGLLRLRARLASNAARELLVASVVQRGFGVRSVTDAEIGLESVFLKLTKGGEA